MLAGPHICTSALASRRGAKQPRPWMWSMCGWVSMMSTRLQSSTVGPCRPLLGQGDQKRQRLGEHGSALFVGWREDTPPLGSRHLARFVELAAEDRLRLLVVVNEVAGGVDDENRYGEVARQLPRQDHLYLF